MTLANLAAAMSAWKICVGVLAPGVSIKVMPYWVASNAAEMSYRPWFARSHFGVYAQSSVSKITVSPEVICPSAMAF